MSNRKKLNVRKMTELMTRPKPVKNWKDAVRRGLVKRKPAGAR